MSKKIYPSKYTDKKVTDAQYLTDFIMERIARQDDEILPYKYWNLPKWNKIFLRQLGEASKLLATLDCKAVIEFLNSRNGKKIYSLGMKKPIIDGAQQYMQIKVDVICKNIELMEKYGEEYLLYDDEVSDSDEISSKPKASLWEKLNGKI